MVCPVPPLFVFSSFSKKTCQTGILRTYGTYVLTKSSLLGCSWTRPSMNSDNTLSPIGKNKVERNSCEKNHYSHYYYFFLFIYYYSFKIFSHFWLAKIPSIIHHNQLLLAKFEEFCNMCTNDIDLSAKLSDYWMVNREDLGMRLSCFVFVQEVQMAQHFTHFTRKNSVSYWLKT